MGFLEYMDSTKAKEAIEKYELSVVATYIKNTNHNLIKYEWKYILTDNFTGKEYKFSTLTMDYPNDIFKQITKNLREREIKKVDQEWLKEKNKRKRRKIYAKKYN